MSDFTLSPPPTLAAILCNAPPPSSFSAPPPDNYCTVPKQGSQQFPMIFTLITGCKSAHYYPGVLEQA